MKANKSIIFGPVPSRRLGRSLGINNIPPKVCNYSCVYCQLGRTFGMSIKRQAFYGPAAILHAVRDKSKKSGEHVDYLTFVPDGEPTLDINLGREIDLLKSLKIPIAVITNASLLWMDDVRKDLMRADLVSLKVDAVEEKIWRRLNRPHPGLELDKILEGMLKFARSYKGRLITETMLAADINDKDRHIKKVADFLALLNPDVAYLAIPTRPPTEKKVQPPSGAFLNRAFHIFCRKVKRAEYLTGFEGDAFASTGDAEADLLAITAVHPMRDDAVKALLKKAGAKRTVIDRMVKKGRIVETEYGGHKFYLRKFKRTFKA